MPQLQLQFTTHTCITCTVLPLSSGLEKSRNCDFMKYSLDMFLKCFHCCVVHTGMMDDIMTVERNVQGAKIPMTDCIVYCLVRKVMMLPVDRNPTRGKKTENLKTES